MQPSAIGSVVIVFGTKGLAGTIKESTEYIPI